MQRELEDLNDLSAGAASEMAVSIGRESRTREDAARNVSAQASRREALKARMQELHNENVKLKVEAERAAAMVDAYTADKTAFRKALGSVEAAKAAVQARAARSSQELEQAREQLLNMEATADGLRGQVDNLHRDNEMHQEAIANLQRVSKVANFVLPLASLCAGHTCRIPPSLPTLTPLVSFGCGDPYLLLGQEKSKWERSAAALQRQVDSMAGTLQTLEDDNKRLRQDLDRVRCQQSPLATR